jgi:GNAT superfamily N-acetyltransferase
MRSFTEITFDEILPVWRDKLWPGRESEIEPVSAIDENGLINMELMKAVPVFIACKEVEKIVGVVSGFKTTGNKFRSRGLWVSDSVRGQGIGQELLLELGKAAQKQGCSLLWTMARSDAFPFYEKSGFIKKAVVTQYEFGPHIICEKKL